MGLDIYEKERVLEKKEKLMGELGRLLYQEKIKREIKEYVFLCVGSDKMTGDCFGPLVGTKLENDFEDYQIFNIHILGNLKNPVCYPNVIEVIEKIHSIEKEACVIVIDAAFSREENIGKIYVSHQETVLGKGIGKQKIAIGDISIKAVVAKDYKIPMHNFQMLQNISLQFVMDMADIVADSIFEVMKYT